MKKLYRVLGVVIAITLFLIFSAGASENPKERIDFWRTYDVELKPEDDPLAKRAHEIFKRVLNAAGGKPGVVRGLYITRKAPENPSTPVSIPNRWIILSKRNLDICYKDPQRGDDRLAFILAHEIEHQLSDDFWHMKFFYAIEQYMSKGKDFKEVMRITDKGGEDPKSLQSKELRADVKAIIYASMAGFNTKAIVMEDGTVNFFEEWIKTVDPTYSEGVHRDDSHPSPKERAMAVKTELLRVLEKLDLFHLGLYFYQTGDYERAILFFGEFLNFFGSREVYHNLATSYHQLALKYYWQWKGDEKTIPFKLSISIDPETRASKITLKGGGDSKSPEELFKEHIDKAIGFYEIAISQDPSYLLSHNNLGCAFIMKGEIEEAIARFKKALRQRPDFKEILNNLGVALYYDEKPQKAKETLIEASKLDPTYNAPLFNLGKIAYEGKKEDDAKKYWTAYLKLDPSSPWAHAITKTIPLDFGKPLPASLGKKTAEAVIGLKIGAYDDEVPKEWGKPQSKDIVLGEKPYRLHIYKNHIMTVSQKEEIKLIVTLDGFKGKTEKGILVGIAQKDVFSAYGSPTKILDMTQGASWVYESQGIVFQLRDGKVVSWILFQNQ